MPRSPLRDPNEEDSDDEDPQERLRTRTEGYDRSRHDRHYNAAANAYDMRRRCGCTDADISPLGCKAIWAGVFIAIVLFSLSIAALTKHTEAGHTDLDARVKTLETHLAALQNRLDAAHQTAPDSLYKVFATREEMNQTATMARKNNNCHRSRYYQIDG